MSAKPVRGGEAIKTDRKINLIYRGLYHAKFGRMMKSCANESRAMLAWALPSAAKIGRRQVCFIFFDFG